MNNNTLLETWNTICATVCSYPEVDQLQFSALTSRIIPQAMSEGFLMLSTENSFLKSWAEKSYIEYISRALTDIYGIPFIVIIEVDPTANQGSIEQPQSVIPQINQIHQNQSTQQFSQQGIPGIQFSQPAVNPIQTQQNFAQNNTQQHLVPQNTNTLQEYPTTSSNFDEFDYHNNIPDFVKQNLDRNNQTITANTIEQELTFQNDDRTQHTISASTFENFVIGDSNRLAYSMAVQVADNPGSPTLNPLFIYGKSGLGKTHLMKAIKHYINETRPYMRTVFVDTNELVSGYTDAVAAHNREKTSYKTFKTQYESADILLVDDIQFLQGKKQTLDIVFQIFNKLTELGKQIVLSADRAPKNIDIDERYSSRFMQGATIDIQPPEIETKMAICKRFINESRIIFKISDELDVPQDILLYIAENSSSNIRELQGAITTVMHHYSITKNLTITEIAPLLENHFSGSMSKNLTIEDIQKEVEDFFKVKHSDLVGKSRLRSAVYPRQIAMYLCRELLDIPYNEIAKKFNRDHATVMHAVNKVEESKTTSRDLREEIEALRKIIKDL
jgi:chromosomal replication initiator protein